jgi:cysteine-rich CPXCG protein
MTARRPQAPISNLDPEVIDALYGLEPVYEPAGVPASEHTARDEAAATQFLPVQCPYCGEAFETLADCSAGSATYIEDCQICCRPIELCLEVDGAGALASFEARRTD